MRTILAILLLAGSAGAQSAPATSDASPVCASLPNTTFEVKTDNGGHNASPVAGKAIVLLDSRWMEGGWARRTAILIFIFRSTPGSIICARSGRREA